MTSSAVTERIWLGAAAVLLLLGAAACGGSGDGRDARTAGKIAVLLPDSVSSDRWERADRRFFEEAFTAAGLSRRDYIISNADDDLANP